MNLPFGKPIDLLAGALSHLLHSIRGAHENTSSDLTPYLEASTAAMFPTPVVPRDVEKTTPRLSLGPRIVDTLTWFSQHVPLCPHYRARHANEYTVNQRVLARIIRPRQGTRRRALIYVHGWLEPGPWIEEASLLPALYDELRVDVLHVQLPFHGSRNPKSALFHGEFYWSADLVRSLEAVRQSVIDVRTLIGWLRSRGYVEVGVTGLSLGGAITMLLGCLESPPDYIVPIIAHLMLGEAIEEAPILWRMREDLDRFGIDRAERKRLFDKLGLEKLRPLVPIERQLWVPARDDQYLTAPLVTKQWEAWGKPPIHWISGGHMTIPLSMVSIVSRIGQFVSDLTPASKITL
jgi:pimeloyl-ACP methyl ester carboxylesterase